MKAYHCMVFSDIDGSVCALTKLEPPEIGDIVTNTLNRNVYTVVSVVKDRAHGNKCYKMYLAMVSKARKYVELT